MWGQWSDCQPRCSRNHEPRKRTRQRNYTQDPKKLTSLDKEVLFEQVQFCEKILCANSSRKKEDLTSEWTSWSKCDVECGRGSQHQYRVCSYLEELTEECSLEHFSLSRPHMRRTRACFAKECSWIDDLNYKYLKSHSASLALLLSLLVLTILIVHHTRSQQSWQNVSKLQDNGIRSLLA